MLKSILVVYTQPGTPKIGYPTSVSSTITVWFKTNEFKRLMMNVDFPEFFGPVTKMTHGLNDVIAFVDHHTIR